MSKNKGKIWIVLGLLLLAAALILAACNLYGDLRAERAAGQVIRELASRRPTAAEKPRGEQETAAADEAVVPDYLLDPDMEMPVETVDGTDYIGVLRIPALELELPVISRWSYPNLRTAPCRYSGSAYLDDLILCGHNYSSHFGRLNDLRPGDVVTLTDMDGNEFRYEVAELETLRSGAVDQMESGEWDLTLFTCTVGGRSRVTVRCERVRE